MTRTWLKVNIRKFSASLLKLTLVLLLILTSITIALGISIYSSESIRKSLFEKAITYATKNSPYKINIVGIAAPSIATWEIDHIDIYKNDSVWITLNDLDFVWFPSQLLHSHIHVSKVHTKSFEVFKTESLSVTAEQPNKPLERINIPKSSIDSFYIDQLIVNQYLPRKAIKKLHYQVEGDLHFEHLGDISSHLKIESTLHNDAVLDVQLTTQENQQIYLSGYFRESADGVFGNLLNIPADQYIDMELDLIAQVMDKDVAIQINTVEFPYLSHNIRISGGATINDVRNTAPNPSISINAFTLDIDDSITNASGKISREAISLNIETEGFPLSILTQDIAPASFVTKNAPGLTFNTLNAKGTITGRPSNPSFDGQIETYFSYLDTAYEALLIGSIAKDGLNINELDISHKDGFLKSSGTLNFASRIMDIKLNAENIDLAIGKPFLPKQLDKLSGKVKSVRGTINGSPSNPNIDIKGRFNGTYSNQPFTLEGGLVKLGNNVELNRIVANLDNGQARLSGSINLENENLQLRANVREFDITLLKYFNVTLPEELNGKINSELEISGEMTHPNISGSANFSGKHASIPLMLNIDGRISRTQSQIKTLTLHAFDEQVLFADGFHNNKEFQFNLSSNKLPTQLLSAFDIHLLPGEFESEIKINGTLEDPKISGSYSYAAKTYGYTKNGNRKEIPFQWNVDISTKDKTLRLLSTFKRENYQPGLLDIKTVITPYIQFFSQPKGSEPFKTLPVDIAVNGEVDLQTLSFLLDPNIYRMVGKVDTQLKIEGSLSAPTVNGQLHLQDAYYENPISGTLITQTNCFFNLNDLKITTDNCQASDGVSGAYQLNGSIELPSDQNTGNIDISLSLDKASILRRRDIESEISGTGYLKGDFEQALATGDLQVRPLNIDIGARNTRNIPTIRVHEKQKSSTTKPKPKFLPLIDYDITFSAENQAFVRGRGLEAELLGKVTLKGNNASPKYDGRFETIRGTLKLFNKTFSLKEGFITFTNNIVSINTTAEYEKAGQRVQATLYGTNNDLNISLSASPEMQEDEILAYIIFGKPLEEVTAVEAIQLATAIQTLKGSGGFDPIDSTRRALGVDSLTIESSENGEGDTGINVGVGKYINDRVYLELERTPNPAQPWKGTLEIELAPNINLESSSGGESQIDRVELKWKRDY